MGDGHSITKRVMYLYFLLTSLELVGCMKDQANEFTMEPKNASGSVIRGITYSGMAGGDDFLLSF